MFFRNLYNSIVYNLQHIPFRLSLASHSRVRRASKYAFRLNKNRRNWIFCLFKRLALRQWTFHRLKAAHLRIPSKYLKHCPRSVGLKREYPTKMSPTNNYHNRECLRHQHIFWSFHRHWRASGKSPCLAWKFHHATSKTSPQQTGFFGPHHVVETDGGSELKSLLQVVLTGSSMPLIPQTVVESNDERIPPW